MADADNKHRGSFMDFGLQGRTGIVTGASQGIGEAIAHALAAEGMRLVVSGRDAKRLSAVATAIGSACGVQAFPIVADLSSQQGVDLLMREAIAVLGNIDVLVNNAGAIRAGSLLTKPDAEWHEDWALKVFGYVRLTRAVFPLMQAAGGGRIVNIIGQAGRQPKADYLAGGGANAAIMNMTKALGDEGGPHNILVNGISPGPIRTQRWQTLMARAAQESGQDRCRSRSAVDGQQSPATRGQSRRGRGTGSLPRLPPGVLHQRCDHSGGRGRSALHLSG